MTERHAIATLQLGSRNQKARSKITKTKWLGHASFVITSDKGIKVVCDPYSSMGAGFDYGQTDESADIVTVSHRHPDHDNVAAIKGNPIVVDTPGWRIVRGMNISGVASYHDRAKGRSEVRTLSSVSPQMGFECVTQATWGMALTRIR